MRHTVSMLMLHGASPRDLEARQQLADALPGAEVGEPDQAGIFDISLAASEHEQALTDIWNAIAASGTDDHIVFLEHPHLPEHWRSRSRPSGS